MFAAGQPAAGVRIDAGPGASPKTARLAPRRDRSDGGFGDTLRSPSPGVLMPHRNHPMRSILAALTLSAGAGISDDGRLVYGSSLNPKTGRAEAGRGARARDRQRNAASGRVRAATAPVIQQAIAPAAIAFGASATISSRRSGTTAPRAPIWTAIDGMFAKPQRA